MGLKIQVRSRRSKDDRIPVIDIFAGPGGLGEGFSAPAEVGGTGRFRIALSIEKDPVAHQTLELRALFRQFAHGEAPPEYYAFLRGELNREGLFSARRVAKAAVAARAEAWQAELGIALEATVATRVREAVGGHESVLIGGPPCQAYSLVGRSRNRGNPTYDPAADGRHTLYREYLKVLATHWPAVFVMENVKGLLSARLEGQSIFARILEDLSDPGRALRGIVRSVRGKRYDLFALTAATEKQTSFFEATAADPRDFVVRAEEFGIPQARHRLIIVGVRSDIRPQTMRSLTPHSAVSVGAALHGLPSVRSGLSGRHDSFAAWHNAIDAALQSPWIRQLGRAHPEVLARMRSAVAHAAARPLTRGSEFVESGCPPRVHGNWYADPSLIGVPNHATRSHIEADLHRYLFASAFAAECGRSPTLSDFPSLLLPNHRNVAAALGGAMFEDRFRVQLADRPATTVTSHIAKDGHYYIHPDPSQCRSLTAREAARLQTFPDNYLFCGGRTAQYHQIGNAVPPLLAVRIAAIVADVLG